MVKTMVENVKDDGRELEMLLNEIPHATSSIDFVNPYQNRDHDHDHDLGSFIMKQNQGKYGNGVRGRGYDEELVNSPVTVSGFSMQSENGSSSSFFSDYGIPTPPLMEDPKSTNTAISSGTGSSNNPNNPFWLDSRSTDFNNDTDRFVDLCNNFSRMYTSNHQQDNPSVDYNSYRNGLLDSDSVRFQSPLLNSPISHRGAEMHSALRRDYCVANSFGSSQSYSGRSVRQRDAMYSQLNGFGSLVDSDSARFQSPLLNNPISHHGAEMNSAFTRDYGAANSFRSSQSCSGQYEGDTIYSQLNGFGGGSMGSSYYRSQHYSGSLGSSYYGSQHYSGSKIGAPQGNSTVDASLHPQNYGMNFLKEPGMSQSPFNSLGTKLWARASASARVVPTLNARRISQGNIDLNAARREGSFILEGDERLSYVGAGSSDRSWHQNGAHEYGFANNLYKSEVDIQPQVMGTFETPSSMIGTPFTLPPNYNSLSEAGVIYLMTKDQNGCRYLQRMFEEGRMENVQVIFNEIIGHMVELMTSPFGNYLIQKLLDVCSEEQRMKIIIMVIQEPGQLVRISLNAHGTRVVQKLIETLKTGQQISLVVSALEPGSLTLIKDLHGNHVIQHCLECLSNKDNKFIYVAAVKYCVDIATHQHGCCVLQKCIRYSSGEHRQILAAEIFANALLLAQDKYGNYVVQCTLDLKIPSAATTLTLQFESSYTHMSMQRYSSHVVEKCLEVFKDEHRAKIIHELISDPHFDQLLQDPQANYVIQKALQCSEGHVYNALVETIESHKAICRNSPYSKKIFSQKLLKK